MGIKKTGSHREKRSGQTFLFVFLIPFITLLTIGAIFLYLLDVNPIKTAQTFFASEVAEEETDELLEERVYELEQQLIAKDEQIASLERELNQIEMDQAFVAENPPKSSEEESDALKQAANVYESMNPRRAADIMNELSLEDLVSHMSVIKENERAAIIQHMEPERAAEVMTALATTSS
ncbi:MotE family protein [Geomicrobium sp. JCM 19038]|uniref:MotE family protein n=1 Tax=Geomicrobium sp. JCM 19038 TaxID=1460635 RepID=UPI00045F327B|nr:hypothetical protein [Geomicrobium sp. JCM 19038]GAK07528.1 flagellar protein FlbB [Geomicrobium sp. JCM 19038]